MRVVVSSITVLLWACGGAPPPAPASAPASAPAAAPTFQPPPPLTAARYRTGKLWPKYRGEEVAGAVFETAVVYLDETQREAYRVHGRDGKLVDATGRALDGGPPDAEGKPRRAIYSMDTAGNLYATFDHAKGRFHHSSFLAGGPVACAGEMVIEDGRIIELTNMSGHYRPPPFTLDAVRERLVEMGVDVEGMRVAPVGADVKPGGGT